MARRRRTNITLVTTALLLCSMFSIGCEPARWAGSASVNLIVPMGLAGSPGLLNPFGIVQALVNAALGLGASGGEASSYPVPSVPSPTTPANPAIGVIVP